MFSATPQRYGRILALPIAALFVCCALAWGPPARAAAAPAGAFASDHGSQSAEELLDPAKAPGPEELQTDLAIWTFVVFIILLLVLAKFAWGPIVRGLQKREQGIADNIAAAQRSYDEAKQYLAEYEKRLANAANEVRAMLEEARRDAEATKQEILAEAKEAARLEQERGTREVRLAMDRALKELSERSTNLAIDLAGRIVQAQLKPSDHARLVQEAIHQFAMNGPTDN